LAGGIGLDSRSRKFTNQVVITSPFVDRHAALAVTLNAYNPPMPDLLQILNPEQLAAVTLPAEPALILAGAGSGKTRVLTTRIAWLISTGQVSPQGVLAVTFTNKAAKEMLARLGSHVAGECAGYVDRHISRPVQPFAAGPPSRCQPAGNISDPR
jgi:hypothetical protein